MRKTYDRTFKLEIVRKIVAKETTVRARLRVNIIYQDLLFQGG